MIKKYKILFTSLSFASILIGIFWLIYNDSELRGFNRFRVAFKLAVAITWALINPSPAFAKNPTGNRNPTPTQIERQFQSKFGPGARARNAARNGKGKSPEVVKSKPGGSLFAEALQNPSTRSRPAATNRLAQQLQPRPSPDLSNPGCAGGPSSITVLSSQRNPNLSTEREIRAHDEVKGRLTDKSANHLTSKHANALDIDDPLPPSPNQKPRRYPEIRTRINKDNKKQFTDTLEKILQDPNTTIFPGVSMRGIEGHGYYTENYGQSGFFVGITTEGELAGQITKAQPISEEQLQILQDLNKID